LSEIVDLAASELASSGYAVVPDLERASVLLFENDTALGFVIAFSRIEELKRDWQASIDSLVSRHQFALRTSGTKAWNAYCVLLCRDAASPSEKAVLQTIEEDLAGTRKIVRAGIENPHDVIQALLPLLPLQNAPELPVIDMPAEIRGRTTELPAEAIEAYFSTATEGIAAQVIEEAQ
jgi:hypothetical protein